MIHVSLSERRKKEKATRRDEISKEKGINKSLFFLESDLRLKQVVVLESFNEKLVMGVTGSHSRP